MAGSQHAYAQASATFQLALGNAELAELSPDKRAQVEARMKQPGQTVPEILQTIRLSSIKLKYPAKRIVALDLGRGVAVNDLPSRAMRTIQFDTRTDSNSIPVEAPVKQRIHEIVLSLGSSS
jgi:hypothetical protein